MSTKIYTGFQIDTNNLAEILARVKDFRKWIIAQQNAVYERYISMSPKHTFSSWREEVKQVKIVGNRNMLVDTDFELVFFPYGKLMFGICFTEREAWFEEWLKQPGVSEHGYWDNSDKPKHITSKQWSTGKQCRRVIWNKLLPGSGIPSMNGFSIMVSDPNFIFARKANAA